MDDLERKILNKSFDYVVSLKQKEREAKDEFIKALVELQQICPHETILEAYKPSSWCADSSHTRICIDCRLFYYTSLDNPDHPFAGYHLQYKGFKVIASSFDEIIALRDFK